MTTSWRRVKREVSRIGVRTLWRHVTEDRWAVSLDNRTYHNFVEIAPHKVEAWKRQFGIMVDCPP